MPDAFAAAMRCAMNRIDRWRWRPAMRYDAARAMSRTFNVGAQQYARRTTMQARKRVPFMREG